MKSLPVARISKVLILLCLTFNLTANAQEFYKLGNFTTEELKMTECAFDKEAPAIKLIDEARADYSPEHHLITTHHIKIKILKEKGIDFGNIEIPFYRQDDFEYIDEIHGVTLNISPVGDVDKHELERSSIFTEKSNQYWGKIKFAFPAVRVGSILEYTYRSVMKYYGGLSLRDWEFQDRIPVVKSTYYVTINPVEEFTYQVLKSPNIPIDIKSNRDLGSVTFEMNNIPGLVDEPYMTSRNDYLQKVRFQFAAYYGWGNGIKEKSNDTWPEFARWARAYDGIGTQLDKSLSGTEEFISQVRQLPSDFIKMNAVYDYVRRQMTWNNVYSLFTENGIKSAWDKKLANSTEINLILVDLLRAVGIEAYPAFVSERYHGQIRTDYPIRDQFNTIYAAIYLNKWVYYLDARNKYVPANLTPYEVLSRMTFIVDKEDGRLYPAIPGNAKYNQQIVIGGAVSDDGVLNGSVRVKSTEYARPHRVEEYKSDVRKFIDEYYKKDIDGISIDSLSVLNENVDTLPFIQNVKFHLPLSNTGEYRFLDLNLFTGQRKNPFIAESRFSDIDFGYTQRILITSLIDIPNSYSINALPSPTSFASPDRGLSFQKTVSFNDGKLVQNCLLEINYAFFKVDQYSTVKEFYKKVYDSLKEPVVLKKK
jgi:hypothetical protein